MKNKIYKNFKCRCRFDDSKDCSTDVWDKKKTKKRLNRSIHALNAKYDKNVMVRLGKHKDKEVMI
ncbi:hypothetical protein DRO97_05170 [Archaeoglobales archaeon]|nr:MAG: hypothetical protein DRO97_05170 [Archaeoglobales archaeon]